LNLIQPITRAIWAVCQSTARAFRQRAFLLATVLLLAAAISMNAAVTMLKVHFKKLPLPLRHDLTTIPNRFGNWVQVSVDQPLNKELQDTLSTDKYIFRDYIDTTRFSAAEAAAFDGKNPDERGRLLAKLQVEHPEGVIDADVTYYTGLVDTVAHIPDRCYIASGYEPKDGVKVETWDLGSGRLTTNPRDNQGISVRYIDFEDQTGASKTEKNVAYFFHVNGHYESDPEMVRASLQNLLEKYGYYAKVELQTVMTDQNRSEQVMQDFLRQALPGIEAALPDWEKATAAAPQKTAAGG
jgi:hypothetical protein